MRLDSGMAGLDGWGISDLVSALNPIAAVQHALDVAKQTQALVASALGVSDPLFNEIVRVSQNALNDTQHAVDAASTNLTNVLRPFEDVIVRNKSLGQALDESSRASMMLDPLLNTVIHEIATRTGQSADDVAHAARNIAVVVAVIWVAWELGIFAGAGEAIASIGSSIGSSVAVGLLTSALNPTQSQPEQPSQSSAQLPIAQVTQPQSQAAQDQAAQASFNVGKVLPFIVGGAAIVAATMM